jgi:hypothetical protein
LIISTGVDRHCGVIVKCTCLEYSGREQVQQDLNQHKLTMINIKTFNYDIKKTKGEHETLYTY